MHRKPHPWPLMAAVFGGVLLCSFVLDSLFTPAADAVLNRMDRRRTTLTGTIGPSRSANGRLVLHDGAAEYILADQRKARSYAGRAVRVTGILHESTEVFEIQKIELAGLNSPPLNRRP